MHQEDLRFDARGTIGQPPLFRPSPMKSAILTAVTPKPAEQTTLGRGREPAGYTTGPDSRETLARQAHLGLD
jgi:hypothetical protein